MSALSISTIAASDSGARAAAAPAVSDAGGTGGSPFAVLLAAISQADPSLQAQQTSGPQSPPSSDTTQTPPGTTQTPPGSAQAPQPVLANDPTNIPQASAAGIAVPATMQTPPGPAQAPQPTRANDPTNIPQANAAGTAVPGTTTAPADPLSDIQPVFSGTDDAAANIKADGRGGKKPADGKDDNKAGADLPQTQLTAPSFFPVPIVPPQTVQVQIVANDNDFSKVTDGTSPTPVQNTGATAAPTTPTLPSPVAGPASTGSSGAPAPPTVTGDNAPLQQVASGQASLVANDGDDDSVGQSENAASVQSFPHLQFAAEKSSVVSPLNGKTEARQPDPAQVPQTAAADAGAPNAFAAIAADATQTGNAPVASGANMAALADTPASSAPAKPETGTGTGVSGPAAGDGNIAARPAVQNLTAADAKPAIQDFSSAQPTLDGKSSSDGKPPHPAAGTDTAPQPQPAQPLPAAHAGAQNPVPQTIAVTLGGPAPQNGGPNGLTLPIHIAVHDSDAASGATAATPDTDALAVSIAARSLSGAKQFDIRLDPPELGRVEVRLSIDASGKTEAHLTTDQPQTLALLQKDAPILTRALRDAGLDVSQSGLNFSLKGQGQNPGGQGGNFGTPSRGFSLPAAAQSIEAAQAGIALPSLPGSARLDIHV